MRSVGDIFRLELYRDRLYSSLLLLQGLKGVVSYHTEVRERRMAASASVLPLAQNLLSLMVVLGTRLTLV